MNIIPMTFDCEGANALRDRNIRRIAFPFDWNIATIYCIYKLFENDFKNFLNIDSLIYSQKHNEARYDNADKYVKIIPVLEKNYGFLFVHDFDDTNYNIVYDKYVSRIARMINCLKHEHCEIIYKFDTQNILNIYNYWNAFFENNDIIRDNIKNANHYSINDLQQLLITKYNNSNIKFTLLTNP